MPNISRADFDGSNMKVIVSSGLSQPNGIVVDGSQRLIYWVDGDTNKLESCDFNVS